MGGATTTCSVLFFFFVFIESCEEWKRLDWRICSGEKTEWAKGNVTLLFQVQTNPHRANCWNIQAECGKTMTSESSMGMAGTVEAGRDCGLWFCLLFGSEKHDIHERRINATAALNCGPSASELALELPFVQGLEDLQLLFFSFFFFFFFFLLSFFFPPFFPPPSFWSLWIHHAPFIPQCSWARPRQLLPRGTTTQSLVSHIFNWKKKKKKKRIRTRTINFWLFRHSFATVAPLSPGTVKGDRSACLCLGPSFWCFA